MDHVAEKAYRFDAFTLDVLRHSLRKGDREIELRPKSFDVLAYLVANAGRLVTKDEIIDAVWSDVTLSDESLTRCVSDVRLALGDKEQRIIKTSPRRGYVFAAPVHRPTDVMPRSAAVGPAPLSAVGETARSTGKLLPRRKSAYWMGLVMAVALVVAAIAGAWLWRQGADVQFADRPAIAVLPFVNLSGDAGQNYFSDGITEEITTSLYRFGSLLVIAPGSAFKFRGREGDVGEIGRELGVRYLLQGSLRKDPERLRVSVQLIEAATGAQLWAERYDSDPQGVFSVQDDVTQKIVSLLAAHITKSELDRAARKRPESLDAYDHTLRAGALLKSLATERRGAVLAEARALYEQAADADPGYAPAVSGLANTYLWAWLEPSPDHSIGREFQQPAILDRAEALARQAIALDETLPEARATLGWILYWRYRPTESIAEFARAFALNPGFADWRYGLLLSHGGRAPDAIAYMKRIMRIDPLYSPRYLYLLGKGYFFVGRYEEAIDLIKSASAQMPGHRPSRALHAAVAAHLGRTEEARAAAAEVLRVHPQFTVAGWMKFMRISDPAYADRLVTGLRKAGLPN